MSVWAAAGKGDLNGVKAAVENGADIEEQGGEYPAGTGLHHACYKGYFLISYYFIQCGAGLNFRNKHGSLPIIYACIHGHLDTVKFLSKRSDFRSTNNYGRTPLHLASANGHTSVAQHLIQCCADVNSMDKDGYMPIHYACQNTHLDTVKLLIREGGDFTSTTKAGLTPLGLASLTANPEVADYLIGLGAAGNWYSLLFILIHQRYFIFCIFQFRSLIVY